jgi:pimeloyl-ACP methyl ester carboxylesterase
MSAKQLGIDTEFGVVRAVRHDRSPDRVALVLPGVDYTPAGPLLHFSRRALEQRDWTVLELWWDYGSRRGETSPEEWTAAHLAAALAELGARDRTLIVGKSLGTYAASAVAERSLPAVWLTPLLHLPAIADALARAAAPTLLVCGERDGATPADALAGILAASVVISGADHGLEVDDPLRSIDILRDVVTRVGAFADEL